MTELSEHSKKEVKDINVASDDESTEDAFEKILLMVGGFGKYQWFLWFIVCINTIFIAYNNVSAAFVAAAPDFWCVDPNNRNVSIEIFKKGNVLNTSFHEIFPKCKYYNLSSAEYHHYWENGISPEDDNVTSSSCQSWYYDKSEFESTVVTEWDLVCKNKWLMSTVQASSVFGFLVGGILLSELSDMYGRFNLVLSSCVGAIVITISASFANHYVIFIILKFIGSFFFAGMGLCNFVILMEASNETGRTILGINYQQLFGYGVSLLAGIAYFFRTWRTLNLVLFVPSVILLLYYKILPESPRWLLLNGKSEEAVVVLKRIAKVNGKEIDEEKFQALVSGIRKEKHEHKNVIQIFVAFFKNQFVLFQTPIMRRRCCIMFFEWFVVGMVYYGLVFNSPNINASRYILVCLSGFSEAFSVIICCWTTKKFGRRLNLLTLLVICGLACLFILFVPKEMVWLNITLSTIGKFANAAAFGVVYVYAAEIVPTKVRNIAVGASSLWARIGSISAPYIVDLLGEIHYAIPSTAFGILSIVAGLLCFLLPETGNKPLPESIEEIEKQKK